MATIYKRLSKRVQANTGLVEVLLTLKDGHSYFVRAKSGIFITPDNFKNGEIAVNRRKVGNDVLYHEEQLKKLTSLESYIYSQVKDTPKEQINSDWFKLVVDRFMNPDKYTLKVEDKPTFFDLAEEYLSKKQFSYDHTKAIKVLVRDIARYEGFIRATDNKDFTFDVDKVTREDIEDFFDYLRNEFDLSVEYPKIFESLMNVYPLGIRKNRKLEIRGDNTIIKLAKKLKAFFRWLYESGKTSNRPFEGIKIGSEKFGTPYYISIDERNKIAETDCGTNALNVQRDIFVFHCFVGCRVGDLIKLTEKNIENGILVYTPHKTKDGEDSVQARIPLHPKAIELLKKYKGVDHQGRLFPFISPQKYNDAIKAIFALAGITRNVEVRNPKTGESEIKPINEIASSHLARRTFVGNAYFKVSDPNIICKMSGHVEGSRAFTRYRKIEDSTLIDVINQLG
jgi:integrase